MLWLYRTFIFMPSKFQLHECMDETVYCSLRDFLKRLSETKGRHYEEIWVLDLEVNFHVAAEKWIQKIKVSSKRS